MNIKKFLFTLSSAAALACTGANAAVVNLVHNGSFESTTNGGGWLGRATTATDWTTVGYNFLFEPGTVDTVGSPTGSGTTLKMWGPGNGSNNGLSGSPDGGNFVALDGGYMVAPLQQVINGLVAGARYDVSFYWAAAQQSPLGGATWQNLIVSLGNESLSSTRYLNASRGFSGWMEETLSFTAQSSSQMLSFLAVGVPTGIPPFALLDGVTMTQVPEPSSIALFLAALGAIGVAARRRNRATTA